MNEKRLESFSRMMRFGISLIIPAWGAAIAVLGVIWTSPLWIACGVAVIGVGAILSLGGPLVDYFFREG